MILYNSHMASTRNRNTQGDYRLEQRRYRQHQDFMLYPQYGLANNTHLPGNGLLPAQLPWSQLSHNAADTESFLFGIGSTNLVNPPPCFRPEITQLRSVDLFEKSAVLMPEPLVIYHDQRPFPIPK